MGRRPDGRADGRCRKDAKGEKVAELPRTVITMRPWLAMQKAERALSRIDVMRPKIYLTMNDKNRWNMQNLLKPSDSEETPFTVRWR